MRKIMVFVLCLALFIPGMAMASNDDSANKSQDDLKRFLAAQVVVDAMSGEDKPTMIKSCTYNESSDTICTVGQMEMDYDTLMAIREQMPEDYQETAYEVYVTIAEMPLTMLEGVDGLICITTFLSSDNRPVFLSINGIDFTWMLGIE